MADSLSRYAQLVRRGAPEDELAAIRTEIAGKRDWTYRQVLWHARTHGIPLDMPRAHPFNPLGLLRLALACSPDGAPSRPVCEAIFRHVVLRPALQKVWPALSSQIVIVMLGTSVVSQIAAQDLTFAANFIQSRNFRAFETYLIVTALYFALALLLRQLLAWVGQRFVVVRRVPAGPVAARTVTTTPAESAA